MVSAFIFDMDGLMIDSEPFWRKAEIDVFNQMGIKLTEDDCRQVMGMRLDVVIKYFYERQPWSQLSLNEVETQITDRMETYIRDEVVALPGVYETLELARELNLKIALASSSPMRLIQATVDTLNIRNYFEHIASAENEEYGKPDPAVYLTTARIIDVNPEQCLVFEDSVPGVKAALSAGMKCVAVPAPEMKDLDIFASAHLKLASLTEFNEVDIVRIYGT